MNYFDVFKIPVSFFVDEVALRAGFYELSKQFHPDRNSDVSEDEKEMLLDKLSEVNTGFEVLSDTNKRTQHILDIYGFGELDKPSPEFLGEIMDINEALMEMEFDFDNEKFIEIENAFLQKEDSLNTDLDKLFEAFDKPENKEVVLNQVFQKMSEKKYLLRIKERLSNFADQ